MRLGSRWLPLQCLDETSNAVVRLRGHGQALTHHVPQVLYLVLDNNQSRLHRRQSTLHGNQSAVVDSTSCTSSGLPVGESSQRHVQRLLQVLLTIRGVSTKGLPTGRLRILGGPRLSAQSTARKNLRLLVVCFLCPPQRSVVVILICAAPLPEASRGRLALQLLPLLLMMTRASLVPAVR